MLTMATFHYTKETPPDSMFNDIQALNRFKSEQFSQLVNYSFLFLTEPSKSSRLLSQLEEFAGEQGVGTAALKNVFKSLLSIPHELTELCHSFVKQDTIEKVQKWTSEAAMKKTLTPDQIKEDLVNLGLSEDKAIYFSEQWQSNLAGLSKSALSNTLMVNQLIDMEWKFGVTAASSELNKVGNTFLQLKLVINTGNGTRNVYMELTLPQFYNFLHEMEKAKASLEYLT